MSRIGCTQPGRWHCYDVWQHTAVAVELLDVAGMDDKNARISAVECFSA